MPNRPPADRYPMYFYSYNLMNISTFIKNYVDELASKRQRLIVYRPTTPLPKIVQDYIADNYTCIYKYGSSKIGRLQGIP